MNTQPRKKAVGESESEVWNAIAAFERILEAMPNDRVALETLYEAYEQIGQTSKAVEYLLQLAESVVEENDADAAPGLIAKVEAVQDTDPAARDLCARLQMLLGEVPAPAASPKAGAAADKRKALDITSELSLAWQLLQAGQLTQEHYSSVVHDLSEGSASEHHAPITVLHVLHARGFSNLEEIMAFLAKDSGTPVVTLANFEIQPQASAMLPLEFMETKGALVFELMERDILVAILNPYDKDLRAQVESLTGRKAHFFLVSPADYDRTLNDIRNDALAPA